jgi:diguanylate cyclase (GGDEF)-like protein
MGQWMTRLFTNYCAVFILFSAISSANASLLNDYLYENWSSQDGLPHNSINDITQTDDGYLWFATWEGIARFNGRDFKHFTRGPESGLIDSGVRTLFSDQQGGLLAGGARGGLVYRVPYQWHAIPPIKNLVNAVFKQPDGGLWVGLQSEGLIFRSSSDAPNQVILPKITVYQIKPRSNGDLLVSTHQGLYIISNNRIENINKTHGLALNPIHSAVEDQAGNLLFGGKSGAWLFKNNKVQRVHPALNDIFITKILVDSQNNYWFGTLTNGVHRLIGQKLTSFDDQQGLPNNRVLSIYQDREQAIWIGTNAGLTRLRQAPFTVWNKQRGLTGDYIRTVLALDTDHILVGSSSGLNVIHGKQIRKYPFSQNSQSDTPLSILSLAKRAAGGAWVGTYDKGLYLFNQNGLTEFRTPQLPNNEVRAIVEDSEKNVWIGTTAGLVKYDAQGKSTTYTTQDGLPDNYIMALSIDSQGQIWVGTGVGVAIINQQKTFTLNLKSLEQAEYVFGFYSQEDFMWMATDRGLIRYRYSDQELSLIGRKNGLPIDKLFQVVPDSSGYFWLTSNRGIWRISIEDANQVANGVINKLHVELYNERDGMGTAQANGGSNPATAVDSSGTLWFATAKGVASTHPQNFKNLVMASFPTMIERVQVDQTQLDLSNRQIPQLAAGSHRMRFDFIGLGYTSSQHILYKTKLEGLDTEWIKRGSQHTAEYTNLSPGDYTFVVSAFYPYHSDDSNQARFSFTIQPHWWQRTSLQFASVFLIIISVALSIWWRMNGLKHSELKLTQEVAEKTRALQLQASAFEKQAREDQLTGLNNRRAFDEWVDEVMNKKHQRSLSIAIIDIDHFKQVNDSYNHLLGDMVLQQVANDIREVSPSDVFVARWGGEEFVLGVIGWPKQDVDFLCETIRVLIKSHSYGQSDNSLSLTVSTGLVHARTSSDFEHLLRCADMSLLKVKQSGRDAIFIQDLTEPEPLFLS